MLRFFNSFQPARQQFQPKTSRFWQPLSNSSDHIFLFSLAVSLVAMDIRVGTGGHLLPSCNGVKAGCKMGIFGPAETEKLIMNVQSHSRMVSCPKLG